MLKETKTMRHIAMKKRRTGMITQHGSGFRESARNFGRKVVALSKKGVNFILNNANELLTLGKAGYDIYQGREGGDGALKALQKIQSRIGDKEKEAIQSLIKGKKKDIKAEMANGNVSAVKKDVAELKKLEVIEKTAKVVPPNLISQIKTGIKLKKPKVVPSSSVPKAKEVSSLLEQIRARREKMGLNELNQADDDDEEWGSGKRVKKNLMKLVSKTMKKERKYKGQTMEVGEVSGKPYVTGKGLKISDALAGVSGVSGAISSIPVASPVALPVSVVTGIASSIAKMLGKGKYQKMRSKKMMGSGIKDIAMKIKQLIMKYGTKDNIELARKVVKSVTGKEPAELVQKVLEKLQSKL
jgi:hypothetical protein